MNAVMMVVRAGEAFLLSYLHTGLIVPHNSIYTITIGALDEDGLYARYSEPCTAVMAVAFGGYKPGVDTTDSGSIVGNYIANSLIADKVQFSVGVGTDESCNEEFSGTSAAAPAAAAIFALALEARPELTWRDIQYLCVKTARVIEDEFFWSPTASGGQYSNFLGFGLLDAHAFVKAARTWQLVEPQVWIGPHYVQLNDGAMDEDGKGSGGAPLSENGVTREVEVTKEMVEEVGFDTIEHIQVRVWITHEKRGDIRVILYSPNKDSSGSIVSTLASGRDLDESTAGFQGWTFSTLRHWYVFCVRIRLHVVLNPFIGERIRWDHGKSGYQTNLLQIRRLPRKVLFWDSL